MGRGDVLARPSLHPKTGAALSSPPEFEACARIPWQHHPPPHHCLFGCLVVWLFIVHCLLYVCLFEGLRPHSLATSSNSSPHHHSPRHQIEDYHLPQRSLPTSSASSPIANLKSSGQPPWSSSIPGPSSLRPQPTISICISASASAY